MTDLSQSIRGARDLYPKELAIRNWLFSKWREVARSFGYEEIDGPILEKFELFSSKSGEELVNQQMYSLEDRDGEKLGLRPELTPTFSRMVAKKQGELVFPLRWTMFGNAWRYEKPQKGRVRDFWQWELNTVGGNEAMADAEVISIAANAMKAIGLTEEDIVFRINDRRFMKKKLNDIGIREEDQYPVFQIIDKKERLSKEEYIKKLIDIKISNKQIKELDEFLNNKDYSESENLTELFSLLKRYGVEKYVKYDPLIVRGITYYTGTVFECFDRKMEFRSVFGGGRFDDLVETFGGGKMPAVGFAIGDVVVTELLKSRGKLPQIQTTPTRVLVSIFSPEFLSQSIEIVNFLRDEEVAAEIYPDENSKLDKQLKYADRKQIPFVVIIGPDEKKEGKIILKNLKTKEQTKTTLEKLISLI